MMRNLLIADTQEITNLGIISLVQNSEVVDFADLYTVNNKADLIKLMTDNVNSVVILDYSLFDFSSINEIQILSERYPESSWILFSDELSDSFLRYMLTNDLPFSIVLKSSSIVDIEESIRQAFIYQKYIGANMDSHLRLLKRSIDTVSDYSLTATEKEILKEMALGKTTKQIAFDRNVSFHTIMTHRKNIFRKLDVNNVHEAIKSGVKSGIVDLSEYYI